MSLPILPKEAESHYFEDLELPICVDVPPLNSRNISKNLSHGNVHNFQARTTLPLWKLPRVYSVISVNIYYITVLWLLLFFEKLNIKCL